MSTGEVVLLICVGLWLLRGVQLLRMRMPLVRAWRSYLQVVVAIGASGASWWWWPAAAPGVGVGLVVVLLILPAAFTREAARALRFGHRRLALTHAWLAFAARPVAAQRRLITSLEQSWRLRQAQAVDIDAAVASLGPLPPAEAQAHRLVFTSWTNDFERMAELLADPSTHAVAMGAGMASIVTMAVGETADDDALAAHAASLLRRVREARRGVDVTWALVMLAAYLGDPDAVAAAERPLRAEVPRERLAFALATAQQRRGDEAAAMRTVDAALAADPSPAGAARLRYRLAHPRPICSETEALVALRAEVRRQLEGRLVLSALALGLRDPAPLTWAVAAGLSGVFLWQTTQTRRFVFQNLALNAPWERAPDPYRLVSYACLHLDGGHLFVNVLGLLVFGRFVEHHFGRWRHAVIYWAAAVAGGVAYLVAERGLGVAIGASGAVLGLFGATVARIALDRDLRQSGQGRRELRFLAAVAVLQLALDAVWPQSAGSAHAGGLVTGLILGAVLMRRPKTPEP